jgi:hypothetical protein
MSFSLAATVISVIVLVLAAAWLVLRFGKKLG